MLRTGIWNGGVRFTYGAAQSELLPSARLPGDPRRAAAAEFVKLKLSARSARQRRSAHARALQRGQYSREREKELIEINRSLNVFPRIAHKEITDIFRGSIIIFT